MASESLTINRRTAYPVRMARPRRGFKLAAFRVTPPQHKALTDAALRARLEGLPEAADGASLIVRELVQAWIDAGAKWPAGAPAKVKRKK